MHPIPTLTLPCPAPQLRSAAKTFRDAYQAHVERFGSKQSALFDAGEGRPPLQAGSPAWRPGALPCQASRPQLAGVHFTFHACLTEPSHTLQRHCPAAWRTPSAAAIVADQNAKLAIFVTRPAIYAPVRLLCCAAVLHAALAGHAVCPPACLSLSRSLLLPPTSACLPSLLAFRSSTSSAS